MILVIEGVDKAGKSTLTEKIAKEFPGITIKITDRPIDSTERERMKILRNYYSVMKFIEGNPRLDFVLDRFFPSEICYSIKRGYEAKEDAAFKSIENWFKEREHLFIFCHPGTETIEQRMRENPDEHVSLEENLGILKRYENFFDSTELNYIKIDTSLNTEETLQIIKNRINEHQRRRTDNGQLSLF